VGKQSEDDLNNKFKSIVNVSAEQCRKLDGYSNSQLNEFFQNFEQDIANNFNSDLNSNFYLIVELSIRAHVSREISAFFEKTSKIHNPPTKEYEETIKGIIIQATQSYKFLLTYLKNCKAAKGTSLPSDRNVQVYYQILEKKIKGSTLSHAIETTLIENSIEVTKKESFTKNLQNFRKNHRLEILMHFIRNGLTDEEYSSLLKILHIKKGS